MESQSRRDLLRIAAGAVAVGPLMAQPAGDTKPLYFTPAEFRMVDDLSEIIIPADDHSPGAHAANVAVYLDKTFAESFEDGPRHMFRQGLKVVDQLSQQMNGKTFLDSTPAQRVEVVTRMSQNERDPKKPEERFFGQLKSAVVFAYYTSKIGIHQEMEYKGNTVQTEFSGFDADLVPIQLPENPK